MDIKKVKVLTFLKSGERIFERGQVFPTTSEPNAPIPTVLVKEVRLNTGTVQVLEGSSGQLKTEPELPEEKQKEDSEEEVIIDSPDVDQVAEDVKTELAPGELVRKLRTEMGVSQAKLGELLDIPGPVVSNIENDKRNVGLSLAKRLAHVFKGTDYTSFIKRYDNVPDTDPNDSAT